MTLDQVMKYYKADGVYDAANKIGVTAQTIYNWQRQGIPRSRQLELQDVTRGKLKADNRKTKP